MGWRSAVPCSLQVAWFAWHGTDANNLHDIMKSELRGTYQKTRKEMKSWEWKNMNKKDNSAWPALDVVQRMHLMQSPYPVSDDRCVSGMRHGGGSKGPGDKKVVDAQIQTNLK